MKVFDSHGPSQPLCAQKVWEALLSAFPLDHKRMQTVLLAREIAHMMRWDGDSKGAVNRHFASITETWRTMGYIGPLYIEDEQEERARVWQPESSTEWRWWRSTLRAALQN
jgi:sugar phosphate isomerase/epimerase